MEGYAYYFSEEVWLGVDPTVNGFLESAAVARSILKCTTRHGIIINHSCDGLVAFGLKDYAPFSSEEDQDNIESQYNFEKLRSFIAKRTELMNAHYICLKAAILDRNNFSVYTSWISPNNIMSRMDINDFSQGGQTKRKFDKYRYIANHVQNLNPALSSYFKHMMGYRFHVVDQDAIVDAVDRFDQLCDRRDDGAIKLGGLYNLAVSSIEDHDYQKCLVTCWVIIENILKKKWKSLLLKLSTVDGVDGKKYKQLEKIQPKNNNVTVIIEILLFSGEIDFEVYKNIEKTRESRNKWMHGLNDVAIDGAKTALRAASELFKIEFGVQLPSDTALQL
jgi:hypothetical protein